jgi:YD repeat-containing protein
MGRLVLAVTPGVSTNLYGYNLYGQMTNETVFLCAAPVGATITRSYDALGRETGFSLGPDYEVAYGYDEFGRFHSVSSSVAGATAMNTYAYLAGSDLLAGLTNSSGFSWTRTFETNRNLLASVENRFGTNRISRFDYDNDSLARRTRRVDNLNVTNDFGYNVRSEVTDALMGTNSYSYAYDPIGNRLTATNNAEGWTYQANRLNQYTNIADGAVLEPSYDADGNMTASGDGWSYGWNAENRMILASNGTTVVTFAYDHQGRRVAKTVGGTTKQFLWDGWNMVADASTAETNLFVWGLDLSQSLQGAGGVGGLLYGDFNRNSHIYYAFDGNGNVSEVVGTNGAQI